MVSSTQQPQMFSSSTVETTKIDFPVQKASRQVQQATLQPQSQAQPLGRQKHIVVVTGPAGCGKTTVAEHVAMVAGIPCIEGDSYHPAANVEKMRSGTPLTDADRWDWLATLRGCAVQRLCAGSAAVIVICSALKREYRDILRVASHHPNTSVHFLYLTAPLEIIAARVAVRKDHYMGEEMVQGQFDILEEPFTDETDTFCFDTSRMIEDVQADVAAQIRQILVS